MEKYVYFELPREVVEKHYKGPVPKNLPKLYIRVPKHENEAPIVKRFYPGQALFYKDRRTGQVHRGTVKYARAKEFYFQFGDDSRRWLDKSVLGKRLFFSYDEAERFGMMTARR